MQKPTIEPNFPMVESKISGVNSDMDILIKKKSKLCTVKNNTGGLFEAEWPAVGFCEG